MKTIWPIRAAIGPNVYECELVPIASSHPSLKEGSRLYVWCSNEDVNSMDLNAHDDVIASNDAPSSFMQGVFDEDSIAAAWPNLFGFYSGYSFASGAAHLAAGRAMSNRSRFGRMRMIICPNIDKNDQL